MKAKGLQKLKWYCQMCEKQCRDENGFKARFLKSYLIKCRYVKTKILANTVYQEMISDKTHVHMNSTVWTTLSEFVLYLARSGKCKVEDTPRGWVIEYIDQEKLRRLEEEEGKRKRELSAEQYQMQLIQKQIDEARERGGFQEPEYTPLIRKEGGIIRFDTKLNGGSNSSGDANQKPKTFGGFKQLIKSANITRPSEPATESKSVKKRKSALELLAEEQARKRQAKTLNQQQPSPTNEPSEPPPENAEDKEDGGDSWIAKDIYVKVILQDHPLCGSKFKIVDLVSRHIGLLEDVETMGTIEMHENCLETVVPRANSKVKILKGPSRGTIGTLLNADPDTLTVVVQVQDGVENLTYDDISLAV
ncbi:bifunctional DNA-RNA-binding protein Kin17 [Babesia duncani]|uniref:Bifunctional DNA-RNA-binding protein Kin17 n=1 Tax=Babesia duncani TaxID=323732 RepID=A0AAD9PLN5_9APIC|nr:bifunctional DNA-RNA-binding protein Kin17 [Babesia duncani]